MGGRSELLEVKQNGKGAASMSRLDGFCHVGYTIKGLNLWLDGYGREARLSWHAFSNGQGIQERLAIHFFNNEVHLRHELLRTSQSK